MGKVSNQCTCPDRSYANCHRTSRCLRCGNGFCTYGGRHNADDVIEPHSRQILPTKLRICCSIWSTNPISNPKNTKYPYDKITEKISREDAEKYGSTAANDYQNLGPENWEMYTSNKKRRYAQKTAKNTLTPAKTSN